MTYDYYDITDGFASRFKKYKAKVYLQMQADGNDQRHGTYQGYKFGCRCDRCLKAGKEYRRKHERR